MDLTGVDDKVDAPEDLVAVDLDSEALDLEKGVWRHRASVLPLRP